MTFLSSFFGPSGAQAALQTPPARQAGQVPFPPAATVVGPELEPSEPTPQMSDTPGLQLIGDLIGREGRYSFNPNDSGGETIWGVTVTTARAFGYDGEMISMPREVAVEIYLKRFWRAPRFNDVYVSDKRLGVRLLDIGVNCGQSVGVHFLQRSLNVLGDNGKYFQKLVEDGNIGDVTLYTMQTFFNTRGQEGRDVLLGMVQSLQSVRYIELAEKSSKNEDFEFGWQHNRAFMEQA